MMLFADHQLEFWKCKILVDKFESNIMEIKEIEAWAEGVIIGAWRDAWTKPEPRVQRARQWRI